MKKYPPPKKNLKSSNLPAGLPAGRQAGPKGSLRFSKSFFLKAKYSLSPHM
jgi:hypothetical protein